MGLSTTAKVGIITLIGLVLIGRVIVWKTDILLVGRGYELIASFDNVEGLTIGSEVRFRGLKVGKVTKIDPGPYDIKIDSVIDPNIKIPDDSTLRVAYDGIVGLKFLEIRPGTSETMYKAPEELKGVRTAAIVDFVDIGCKNLEETKAILDGGQEDHREPAAAAFVRQRRGGGRPDRPGDRTADQRAARHQSGHQGHRRRPEIPGQRQGDDRGHRSDAHVR